MNFNDMDEDFNELVRGGRHGRGAGGNLGNRTLLSADAGINIRSSSSNPLSSVSDMVSGSSHSTNASGICKSPVKRRKCARNKSYTWDYFILSNERLKCKTENCTQNY